MAEWLHSYVLLASVMVQTTVESAAKAEASWLQTYGQLIGVAVGAILTGAVAVWLAVMNNRSSDLRLRMQQTHDLQRENQRITRERLEELYELSGHWVSAIENYGLMGLRLAKGQLTYRQYLDLQIDDGAKSKVQKSRMELLQNVYGSPQVNLAVEAVKDAQSAYFQRLSEVERIAQSPKRLGEVVPSSPPADDKLYAQLEALASNVRAECRKLLEAIAMQAKGWISL
ncbi:TPA: hypothetical protein UOJ32_000694 [Stenotrophomonas maltophilia]|nr:hypothetical protein [Stenotrophomonas maltophilia]HEL5329196.1 hypothetical protein [Stenotrophomonas maltophilia]